MMPDVDTGTQTHTMARQVTFRPAEAEFAGSFAPGTRPPGVRTCPWWKDREYLLGGWKDATMWKSACIEFSATAFLVYTSGMIGATLSGYGTKQIGAYVGISNVFLVATFIYATAPTSGGHINPMITFSVVLAGIAYMLAQITGAALGGGVLLGVWGAERATAYHGGGCFYDEAYISAGRVLLNEVFGSMALLFLAYGVGLDPRQAEFYGPRMGPLLVGASLGIVSFATSGVVPGFAGAQMHPARCFGFGVARRDMVGQWIWWFGPGIAAMLSALMYNLIPLHHGDDPKSRKNQEEEEKEEAVHQRRGGEV